MSMRTAELVSEWDSAPFDGGYEGLRTLADRDFSGAVISGSTQLFMLNGRVVGVLDGDIESFENADGTARRAPHDALPLLVVMQARADEPRAQYYTEDTPVSDVDRTLSDGNFTGYVELSENVLSGDYYLVYHQGRSMSVAWVGSSEKLITDGKAFEQADGEVGIYEVMPAAIEPIDIPEPEPDDTGAGAGDLGGIATKSESVGGVNTPDVGVDDDSPERGTAASGPPGSKAAGASQGTAVEESLAEDERRRREASQQPDGPGERRETTADTTTGETTERRTTESAPTERESARSEPEGRGQSTGQQPTVGETEPDRTTGREADSRETTTQESTEAGVAALETRSIPSLDPERSTADTTVGSGGAPTQQSEPTAPSPDPDPSTTESTPEATRAEPQTAQQPAETSRQSPQTAELEAELEERDARIRELEAELRELAAENDDLVDERNRLRDELEEAQAEIRRLEAELEAVDTGVTGGTELPPAKAIDGTNLFVRYHSKGEATLAKAQDDSAGRAAVDENLRLEYHTQFDGEDTVVDGEEFQTFLQGSIHYRFVDWLIRNLLYEIRDTGQADGLSVLYEALPEVDRAELNGNVSVVYTEDGQEHREQEQFDVVVRNRMGNPLVVANINDSRQPATNGQMTDIIRNAERVGNSSGSLAAAFLVTSSFFEPEALETADEATSSGLFSRDKHKSFVSLSRKGGYHLCLLEARNKEFHLAVPEL